MEMTYCRRAIRFIYFHDIHHLVGMAEPEIDTFNTYLSIKEKISASIQNQALSALLFLYRHILDSRSATLAKFAPESRKGFPWS